MQFEEIDERFKINLLAYAVKNVCDKTNINFQYLFTSVEARRESIKGFEIRGEVG